MACDQASQNYARSAQRHLSVDVTLLDSNAALCNACQSYWQLFVGCQVSTDWVSYQACVQQCAHCIRRVTFFSDRTCVDKCFVLM